MSILVVLVSALAAATLGDPALEARALALDQEIRCVQCQNEPIAQSTSDMAASMRAAVRERIAAGDSDDEVRAFFRDRYGDFVLFRPPFDPRTWTLWAAPLALLAAGAGAVWGAQRRGRGSDLQPEHGER